MKPIWWAVFAMLAAALLVCACAGDDDDDDDASDDDTGDDDAGDDDTADDDDDDPFVDPPVDRLHAGTARMKIGVPIGVSLGGDGIREGPDNPYAHVMGGSEGYYDHPMVRVLSLHMNDERLVIAKGTICFATESLRAQVINKVREKTGGLDLERALILMGDHTHSGPARYLPAPSVFGIAGMDVYHEDIAGRIAESFADAVVAAYLGEAPATVGFAATEGFDPGQDLVSDRRCENGPGVFKEDRLWTLRVDAATGEKADPLAVLVGMAMHGVVYEDTFMTGDAPGGVERAVEDLFGDAVTGIYIQGSAGDITPRRSSDVGHEKNQVVEWIGYRVAEMVDAMLPGMEMTDKPELEVITQRIDFDRETLGYNEDEFYWEQGDEDFFFSSAFLCGTLDESANGSIEDCDDPETMLLDGYLGCVFDLDFFPDHKPYFSQMTVSVFRLMDQVFFTSPGEITSHLAVDTRESIADATGVDYENTNVIGFAQSHLFYHLQDWDWLQGGYEIEMSLYGWKMGPFLQNWSTGLAEMLFTPETETPESTDALIYEPLDEAETEAVAIEAAQNPGTVELQPDDATRFDTVTFSWHGGHPGVDKFTVTLQVEQGGEFVDATRPNGHPYRDEGWEMRVRMEPSPSYDEYWELDTRDFLYTVAWETSWNDPAGTLRFRVEGDAVTAKGNEPYSVVSDPFTLAEADSVFFHYLGAVVDDTDLRIRAEAAYPPNPDGWRLRSPLAGGENPAYVTAGSATATVTASGHDPVEVTLAYDPVEQDLIGVTPVLEEGVEHTITIAAEAFDDGYGNTNELAATPYSITP